VIIERIYTSPASGGTQVEQTSVEFIAGSGIRGDRYFGRHDEPGQNVTLIEAEEIEAFLEAHGRRHDFGVTHRNLVTRGVRLNELVGKEFMVGTVRMLGVELCEPCLGLGKMLADEAVSPDGVVKLLVHRAGLRADVLSGGVVSRGAVVQEEQHPLEAFASDWLAAWNAHDLDRILELYEPDFEFSSPVLAKRIPESRGHLRGKESARAYWSAAFSPGVNLHFVHVATFVGVGSLVVHYKGLRDKLCAEFFEFGPSGKVRRSSAHEG